MMKQKYRVAVEEIIEQEKKLGEVKAVYEKSLEATERAVRDLLYAQGVLSEMERRLAVIEAGIFA